MNFRTLTLALTLAAVMPASAQITTVQLAHEIPLAAVRLPATESGTLAFRSCTECPTTTARISSETRWLVNHRAVSLEDFLGVVESRADRSKDYVTVRHHLEKNLVTRVLIVVR